MVVASAVIACGLLLAPEAWTRRHEREHLDIWTQSVAEDLQPIERLLLLEPRLGANFPASEAEAHAIAEAHPALVALVARRDLFHVIVREGGGFRAASSPARERYSEWAHKALESSLAQWHPTAELDPEAETVPSLVLIGRDWIFVKRWVPGSANVEALLQQALGPVPEVRIGVQHAHPKGHFPASTERDVIPRAFAPPNVQTWPDAPMRQWNAVFPSSVLGQDWAFVCQPWPDIGASWSREVITQGRIAWGLALSVAFSMAVGWWLRQGAKRRRLLETGRLASLMHSLKTPLAVHKLRCDSLRMGLLPPVRAAEELLLLGQDLDDLNCLIERGLAGMKEDHGAAGWARLDPEWVRSVADGFAEAFEGSRRPLELQLTGAAVLAHEPSLRSALQTLLENALHHGRGAVRLRSWNQGHHGFLCVSDEGPGLDSEALKALGEPFQRLGKSAREGAGAQGQGLGLHLLFQMARQEGWGLTLESSPGRGFAATLQLPG
jgi:signal transduction histidine kinase